MGSHYDFLPQSTPFSRDTSAHSCAFYALSFYCDTSAFFYLWLVLDISAVFILLVIISVSDGADFKITVFILLLAEKNRQRQS